MFLLCSNSNARVEWPFLPWNFMMHPVAICADSFFSDFPGSLGSAAGGARLSEIQWLFVDLNSFFASCEQQMDKSLRGKPVIVVPVLSDSSCAIAASYEAKRQGVKTGTLVHEAKKLCPDVRVVLAKHQTYVDFHDRILQAAETVLPVAEVHSIDEFSCHLLGEERQEDKARGLALSLKRALAENVGEYVRASVGIAPNRFLAKVATDLQKPDGLMILRAQDLPGRLLDLRVRDLPGIGHNMQKRLQEAGITQMIQLWNATADDLHRIWGGVTGARFWHSLHGLELPEQLTQRRSIGHSHILEPAMRPQPKAFYVGRRLLLKAMSRLRRMEYCTGMVSFGVRFDGVAGTRGWGIDKAVSTTQDSFAVIPVFDSFWQDMTGRFPRLPIKKISVTLSRLIPAASHMPDLFEFHNSKNNNEKQNDNNHTASMKLSIAMDRLNGKYGKDTVTLGQLPKAGLDLGSKIAFTRIPDVEEFWE